MNINVFTKKQVKQRNKAVQFLDEYPEHFTLEQRKEIITKIFDL